MDYMNLASSLYQGVSDWHLHATEYTCMFSASRLLIVMYLSVEGILPKGPYLPCLRMADRAILVGYPRYLSNVAKPASGSVNG